LHTETFGDARDEVGVLITAKRQLIVGLIVDYNLHAVGQRGTVFVTE
jgi:hypothetical protein